MFPRIILVSSIVALGFLATAFAQTPPSAKPAMVLEGPANNIRAAAISLDAKRVLATSDDKKLTTWDLETGKPVSKLDIPSAARAVSETGDGKLIAIAGGRGPAQLLDAATGKAVKELAKDTNGAVISRDGKVLATEIIGDPAANITLFSLPEGKMLRGVKVNGEPSSLSLSRDGSLLAVGVFSGSNENIQIFDTRTGQCRSKLRHATGMVEVYLSDDGATLASRNVTPQKEGIWIWNLKAGTSRPVAETNGSGHAGAFSPDGKVLLATAGRAVLKIDVPTAKNAGQIATRPDAYGANVLGFTPDGKRILRSQLYTIEVWETP